MATKLKPVADKPTRIMDLGAELERRLREADAVEEGGHGGEPAGMRAKYRWRRAHALYSLAHERVDAIIHMISVLPAESLADAAIQMMLANAIFDQIENSENGDSVAEQLERDRLHRMTDSATSFIEGAAGINLAEYGGAEYRSPWLDKMDPYNPAYEDDFVGDDA